MKGMDVFPINNFIFNRIKCKFLSTINSNLIKLFLKNYQKNNINDVSNALMDRIKNKKNYSIKIAKHFKKIS